MIGGGCVWLIMRECVLLMRPVARSEGRDIVWRSCAIVVWVRRRLFLGDWTWIRSSRTAGSESET